MANSPSKWVKGVSGNPKGRPKKERALTTLLETTGGKKSIYGMPNKQLFVQKIWEGLTTGEILFESGYKIALDASEYIQLAKLVLQQIDGAPVNSVDVSSAGEPVANIALVEVVKRYDSD